MVLRKEGVEVLLVFEAMEETVLIWMIGARTDEGFGPKWCTLEEIMLNLAWFDPSSKLPWENALKTGHDEEDTAVI